MSDEPESAGISRVSAVPESLRPHAWKPGQSGNLKGRPKNVLREALLKRMPIEKLAEFVAKAIASGDSRVTSEILAREWPKPEVEMRVTATGADGAPLVPEHAPQPPAPDVAEAVARVLAKMGATQPKRTNGSGNTHESDEAGLN